MSPSEMEHTPQHQYLQHDDTFDRSTTASQDDMQEDQAEDAVAPTFPMGSSAFEGRELLPRRILFLPSDGPARAYVQPFVHFGTTEPPNATSRQSFYRKVTGLRETEIWLDIDREKAARIRREYKAMESWGLKEGDHEHTAVELILKREWRWPERETKTEEVTNERVTKIGIKPIPSLRWKAPPLIGKHEPRKSNYKPFEFDVFPDALYWISLNNFDPGRTVLFEPFVHIFNQRILLPYLTVEHKCDGTESRNAKHQIAASAAMILYNRFLVKGILLDLTGAPWSTVNTSNLRHYGLIMMGSKWSIWLARPRITRSGKWSGCTVDCIDEGTMSSYTVIQKLGDWLNEIHRWGLTTWGTEVIQDLETCVATASSRALEELEVSGNEFGADEEEPDVEEENLNAEVELYTDTGSRRRRSKRARSQTWETEADLADEDADQEELGDASGFVSGLRRSKRLRSH
ncbi:hypothetical protein K490DRAFT_66966 [Saccharata proteae CBS 121410]|uniref:Uncharacterized protein n=1 Tax=Saccharata proteae CBS 121410 TaxID=1314787 RepID=A0A9P4LU08_9PEZI|nr:hypothetical protein K490DRAFT_66966 [Saccharata proteae CBS 121410]